MIEYAFYSLPHGVRRGLYTAARPRKFLSMQVKRGVVTSSGYSLRPFDEHRCIFVHIPKCAGVSVCRALFGNLAGGHKTIGQYQIIFSRTEFESYFKFTFVRNPWDRLFSAYNFLSRGGMTKRDREWAKKNLAAFSSFDDFVKRWLNPSSIHQYIHFLPQHSFICTPSGAGLAVDFLGFFENLDEDMEHVARALRPGGEISVGHENKTTGGGREIDFREAYTEETREIVSRVYQKDIELLGYAFDNSSLPSQLAGRAAGGHPRRDP
jgi:hypothetical protein